MRSSLDRSDYNNQLFFAGHRGCGKSTLLAEFGQRLNDRYFTVFFSIADPIEMDAIDHINILFAIAVQLTAKADDDNIEIEQSKMDGFFDWFKERTRIEQSETKGRGEASFDLFNKNFSTYFTISLRSNTAILKVGTIYIRW
jgi:energy-coupling factor transporter ATP-binding protein EcfA2